MVLGDLPIFKKLLPRKETINQTKRPGKKIELKALEVVQLYHVSPIKNRDSILTYGLIPKGKPEGELISYGPRIFVSSTYEDAAFDFVNFEDVDVWTFYLPKDLLHADEFSDYANHYFLLVPVAWYQLVLFESR
jgi:hypothetical protein